MQQISVLETNIGSSTTGNSNDTEIIFNDAGTLRGDKDFAWNKTSNILTIDGSATITGALTVDTSTLKVDATNHRVGIVNASPAYPLDVTGIINSSQDVYALGGRLALYRSAGASYFDWSTSQDLVWRQVTSVGGAGASTLMTLNSSGLGVGVSSPSYKLDVTDNSTNIQARLNSSNNNGTSLRFVNTGTSGRTWQIGTGFAVTAGNFEIYDATAAVNRLSIDASGNLLVGTTSTAGSGTNGTVSVFGGIKTASGVTAIGPSVATTIFTISASLRGKYSVVAYIANGGVANTIMADIVWDGTNARLVAQNSANLTVTVSGAAIQLTQTVGGTQNYFWSVVWQTT